MSAPIESEWRITLPDVLAAQLSYHLRMAAAFAAAGECQESGSEAVLAWTMLATSWPAAELVASGAASELVGIHQLTVSDRHREAARARAHAVALDLEAHFASVGLRREAELYELVADHLSDTIQTLVDAK
jgi:hypothetical protein